MFSLLQLLQTEIILRLQSLLLLDLLMYQHPTTGIFSSIILIVNSFIIVVNHYIFIGIFDLDHVVNNAGRVSV